MDKSGSPLILLVEDNERNARLFTEILTTNGYRLALASGGPQCLKIVSQLRPQLILMDLQLPGMDGVEVLSRLKADTGTADIPVIALTAHAMPEHRELFLAAGCCAYISKPISYHPFLREIRRVLDEYGAESLTEVSHAGA